MMLAIDRFIASAMSLVRMAPEAPTSAPAMISTGLLMTKPAIAAAVPVNELSSEITTGMSAPPMGSTSVMPKISAATTISQQDDDLELGRQDDNAGGRRHQQHEAGHGAQREHDRQQA